MHFTTFGLTLSLVAGAVAAPSKPWPHESAPWEHVSDPQHEGPPAWAHPKGPQGWKHRPAVYANSTVVDLGYSQYQGVALEAGVDQWLGIQFAAAPTGDLRWRAPRPPPNQPGIQQANAFAPTCIGSAGPPLSNATNEDCLYLNIFAPSDATPDSKLPVWFFIQGGGYAGDLDQNFNATEVVLQSNNSMVFVQINYRVGAFGYLASEKIQQNGELNAGLLDQRFALHWVQEYIHLFGGDPDHVVIHGDSAGAGSVAYHMSAYGGRDEGLFVGAMMESPFWPTHRNVSEMEFQFDIFANNVSCGDAADVLACLRSQDTATLQAADVNTAYPEANGTAEWAWVPVVDGTFSPDLLYNLFEQGKFVHVPLVVGDDTNEGTFFAANASTEAEFLSFIDSQFPHLSSEQLQDISKVYPENGFGSFQNHADYFAATAAAYGDVVLICPGIQVSDSLAKYYSPDQVWNYRYNVLTQENAAAGLGVPHVSEQPAIFGPNFSANKPCDNCSYETYDAPIVPVLMSYWISFILSLDPNTYKQPESPVWETWTTTGSSEYQRLKLQTNQTEMENVPDAQLQRCEFWNGLVEVTEQ